MPVSRGKSCRPSCADFLMLSCVIGNHYQTSQALIRETLAGRKNTSPQNIYETGQLYSAGALKTACIGLQCIGFNDVLYRGLLEHAAHCTQTGKWRAVGYGGTGGGGSGLGFGAAWNANANVGAQSPGGVAAIPGGLSGGDGVLSGSLLSAL